MLTSHGLADARCTCLGIALSNCKVGGYAARERAFGRDGSVSVCV